MRKIEDITGKRFGNLTVIEFLYTGKNYKDYWRCLCDCGKERITNNYSLQYGTAISCGCAKNKVGNGNNRKNFGESSFNNTFIAYMISAKKRKLVFELTKEEFKNLTQQNCYYCGAEPSNRLKNLDNNGDYVYNGLDRVNNSKGYALENCVPCCGICNRAKKQLSETDFYSWVKRIYNHIKERS